MKSLIGALILAMAIFAGGCDRPSQADCERAVDNIRKLLGTGEDETGATRDAAVRSCRGNADKASVDCIVSAKTAEELLECEGDIAEKLFGDSPAPGNEGDEP